MQPSPSLPEKLPETPEAAPAKAVHPLVRAEFKIIYLLLVTLASLAYPNVPFSVGLLVMQLALWARVGVHRKDLKILKNAIPFTSLILISTSLFNTPRDFAVLSIGDHTLMASRAGFLEGLVMAVRFITILSASAVVRISTPTEDFLRGFTRLGVSKNFAMVLDGMLTALEGKNRGEGKGRGTGGGDGNKHLKKEFSFKSLLKGDFYFVVEMFNQRIAEAKQRFGDHDWAVISAVSVIVIALRLVKVLPGIPFAPGFKSAVFIPLYIVTSRLTKRRFAATTVGTVSGIVNFMFGYGRYGVLGIAQSIVPGLVVDLFGFINRRSTAVLWLGLVGFVAGISRVSVEMLLGWIFGLPREFYLIYSPFVLTQCAFGAVSAPLSKYLINNIQTDSGEQYVEK